MELKVWVDGIKRVVCGVTDHTTCQDIVIALAQAMGRTGRFTLIEQWRDNERPLAPNECPLLVLQKWGEFANEVKLILYESGTRRKQKHVENEKMVKKPQDRFTHNFTPPVKTSEAVVRRSLTFTGARNSESASARRGEHLNHGYGQTILPNKTLAPSHKGLNDVNSRSSSSPFVSQYSSAVPQKRQQVRSSSQDRLLSHDHRRQSPQPSHVPHSSHRSSPQHPTNHNHAPHSNLRSSPQQPTNHNHAPQFPPNQSHATKTSIPQSNYIQNPRPPYKSADKNSHSVTVENGPIRPSAFSPVQPRRNSSEDERDMLTKPNTDIPVYTQNRKSSRRVEVEEYDLDTNFPDVVKETGHEFLVEEYHVPGGPDEGTGHHGNRVSWEEQERIKLLRLVTMQNERIKMQDSQLDIIDTEIGSREQKLEDLKLELSTVLEELTELSERDTSQTEEIVNLDNGNLIEEIEREKQVEKDIKSELNSLHARLDKCETDLHQFKTKVKICSEDLEKENEIQKTDEKRRKEEEVKLQSEIHELKKNIEERSKELEDKTKVSEEVQNELIGVSDKLEDQTNELTAVEKELQKENMRFFHEPKMAEKSSKPHESNGEDFDRMFEQLLHYESESDDSTS